MRRAVGRVGRGRSFKAFAGPTASAAPRPDPRVGRWTTADLARRRALVTARAELEAAELRGDSLSVTAAWLVVIDALVADEAARADPRPPGDALDELRRQTLAGDELPRALADPAAWTDEDADGDDDEEEP